jgi:hypothetical protein
VIRESNTLAFSRCTLTMDLLLLEPILYQQVVILVSPVLGWLLAARFGQGFRKNVPSAQPPPPSGTPANA